MSSSSSVILTTDSADHEGVEAIETMICTIASVALIAAGRKDRQMLQKVIFIRHRNRDSIIDRVVVKRGDSQRRKRVSVVTQKSEGRKIWAATHSCAKMIS